MLLSDRSIKKAIKEGRIKFEPLHEECIQPSSVDLHLLNEFRVFKNEHNAFIDSRERKDYTEMCYVDKGKPFILHPGEFVLGCTVEKVSFDASLVGFIEGKSSLGRLGVVIHATAGKVNPGWSGRLTLELSNVGKMPVALYPEMEIAQISFGELTEPAEKPYGHASLKSKYQDADGPGESRI